MRLFRNGFCFFPQNNRKRMINRRTCQLNNLEKRSSAMFPFGTLASQQQSPCCVNVEAVEMNGEQAGEIADSSDRQGYAE